MSSKNCLLLGGAGFIGSRTAHRLLQLGHRVRVLDSFDPQIHGENLSDSSTLKSLWGHVEVQVGDIRDGGAVERALKGMDTVYYFAAGTGTGQSMYQVRQYSDVNVNGAAVLVEQLTKLKTGIRRVVVSSSRAVYGEGAYRCDTHGRVFPKSRAVPDLERGNFNPVCPLCHGPVLEQPSEESDPVQPSSVYGITKYAQEQIVFNLCGALGIPAVALRYQNVFGPGQSLKNPYTGILSIFSQLLLQNRRINVFEDGLPTRDFVFVEDVAEFNVRAAFQPVTENTILNVGTGRRQTLLDVVAALAKAYGKEADFAISGQFRVGDIRHAASSQTQLRQVLGDHEFIGFQDGITQFANWVMAEGTDGTLASSYVRSLSEMAESGLLKGGQKNNG